MRFFTHLLTLVLATVVLAPAGATTHRTRLKPSVPALYIPQTPVVATASPVLSVFPNPSRGQVSLQLAAPSGQDYKFRLNNVLGREVRLLALRPELAPEGLALDISNLPAGLYFYSLLVNDKVVSTNRLTLQ